MRYPGYSLQKLSDNVGQSFLPFPQITMKGGGKMAKIAIRVPEENKETLAAIARQTDKTISKLIRDMIAEYIKEEIKIDYR